MPSLLTEQRLCSWYKSIIRCPRASVIRQQICQNRSAQNLGKRQQHGLAYAEEAEHPTYVALESYRRYPEGGQCNIYILTIGLVDNISCLELSFRLPGYQIHGSNIRVLGAWLAAFRGRQSKLAWPGYATMLHMDALLSTELPRYQS